MQKIKLKTISKYVSNKDIFLSIMVIVNICLMYIITNPSSRVVNDVKLVKLSDTKKIKQAIDSIELKLDTIRIHYEDKISNYNIIPTNERLKLFSERINRP